MVELKASDPTALAAQLRGFGPVGLLTVLVILAGNLVVLPLSAVLVLLWARASNTPYASLGFTTPRSWVATVTMGVLLGVALKLAMKAIVMPLLGADPVNARYHYITDNAGALPGILYAVVVGAGFGEETVFRGFLFERLGRLLGRGRTARTAIVPITATLFALAHYPDQGLTGVEQAAVTGLVFGGIYVVTGNIWLPMIMHAAFDVSAVWLIYRGWEGDVAHWFFR